MLRNIADSESSFTSIHNKTANNAKLSLKRTAAVANLSGAEGKIPKRSQKENLNDKFSELKSKMTSEQQIVIEYMELKFLSVEEQITSAKRSILYDIGQKYQTHSSHHKSNNSAASTKQADESWQSKIDVSFPIKDLEIFKSFDKDLKINIEMRNVVLLKKEIQILYSGVERVTKSVGKENIKATEVFSLIREFIENKYSDQRKTIKIIRVISTYLSGAGVRDGGRLTRPKD
ncbi:hypothetical protein KQX54_012165 [Cotesia glomerata]|uniref:Uncharacterized protein n=1 Tax=Cotesia glomerata TaxID=32391 RepID=A0AAV7IZ26_COTGL|nr:hypothetical protein KQX54_012165 [Cotesia glomerata]